MNEELIREAYNEYFRAYRKKNAEKLKAYRKEWYRKNKGKQKEYTRRYFLKKAQGEK